MNTVSTVRSELGAAFAPDSLARGGLSYIIMLTMQGVKGFRVVPAIERFFEKVNLHGPLQPHCPELGNCWEWIGASKSTNYGAFHPGGEGTPMLAHRWIFEQAYGALGDNECCHKCDNTKCVRPSHLFAGTHSDNVQDCINKGRWAGKESVTHCAKGHPYSGDNLGWYERKKEDGTSRKWRVCKACEKAKNLRRYAVIRAKKQNSELNLPPEVEAAVRRQL